MRIKLLPVFILALTTAGCAVNQSPSYGSFVDAHPEISQKVLIDDGVQQMMAAYPPAHTRLALEHEPLDKLGVGLVTKLRSTGYAVIEKPPQSQPAVSIDGVPYNNSLPFSYVFDSVENLYRFTINIGNTTLSRPYTQKDASYSPVGDWSKKE